MNTRTALLTATLIAGITLPAAAQNATDSAAVRRALLDYAEGFYDGDARRMRGALHPSFAKRVVFSRPGRKSLLSELSADDLLEITRQGGGSGTPTARRLHDLVVLDLNRDAATAKLVTGEWVEYLHLTRWEGRWLVLNALWELTPRRRDR